MVIFKFILYKYKEILYIICSVLCLYIQLRLYVSLNVIYIYNTKTFTP
jgi:hypothetical protein